MGFPIGTEPLVMPCEGGSGRSLGALDSRSRNSCVLTIIGNERATVSHSLLGAVPKVRRMSCGFRCAFGFLTLAGRKDS